MMITNIILCVIAVLLFFILGEVSRMRITSQQTANETFKIRMKLQ